METAGVPPPASAARSERVIPAFKPPDILWYFGAFATAFATFEVITKIPDSQRDLWQLLLALAFFAAFAFASFVLLRTWWIPGGLTAALAVAMVPAIGHGFTSLIGTYPKDVFFDPTQNFSWSVFLIGVVSIVAGLVAFALTRFSFLFFTVVLGISLTTQLLIPGIHHHPSADDHLVAAIVLGAVLVLIGLILDAGGRRRDAFWFHVGGFTNVAVGLAYYSAAPSSSTYASLATRGLAPSPAASTATSQSAATETASRTRSLDKMGSPSPRSASQVRRAPWPKAQRYVRSPSALSVTRIAATSSR